MRTIGGPAADDGAVTIGIVYILDCGSIRIADYSVVSVPCLGGSRNGGLIGIDPAGHVAVSAIGERQAACAQPKQAQETAQLAVTPESDHPASRCEAVRTRILRMTSN